MNIYFVRHGESTENALQIYNWMDSTLTDLGINQSQKVAQRFKDIKIDVVYHSDMVRARMTANEIKKFQNAEMIESELIREQLPPSELLGLSENDQKSKDVMKLLQQNEHNKDYHYSDEENFEDLKKRVFEFLNNIESLNKENILVIGHGYVLRALIGYILYGVNFNSHDFVNLKRSLKTINTGVTVCDVNNKKWTLVSWNDYSHLQH
jgi:probable phosphoglycerate mutase